MMSYGQHKGGEHWANPNPSGSGSVALFNTSEAEVVIDSIKGMVLSMTIALGVT